MDDRSTFLLEMYRQMFSDINRHMTVVWQSVSVVVGAFALLALAEKNIVPVDIAVSLIVILCAWLFAHMLDAGYWYNRNLVIIANIERQFLLQADLKNIQYYFGQHRSKKNKMITHLRIQAMLGVSLAVLVIMFHLFSQILPGIQIEHSAFDPVKTLPYLALLGSIGFCVWLKKDRNSAYANFVTNSPGIDVNTDGIIYGTGHTVDDPIT